MLVQGLFFFLGGGDGAHAFLHVDGRPQGGMQFGVLVLTVLTVLWDAVCGELFEVLVTVRAHFCDIDARVLPGMQVTVQARVCILTVGCKGACSLGGGLGFCLGCWLVFAKIDGWVS